jgi:hypothetical protein
MRPNENTPIQQGRCQFFAQHVADIIDDYEIGKCSFDHYDPYATMSSYDCFIIAAAPASRAGQSRIQKFQVPFILHCIVCNDVPMISNLSFEISFGKIATAVALPDVHSQE